MEVNGSDEPSEIRQIVRVLPRKRVAFVVAVIVVNLSAVAVMRGQRIATERAERQRFICPPVGSSPEDLEEIRAYREELARMKCVAVWDWTTDEWRATVWPWK